eukprot:12709188-Heterocapsa_arctica.AAC.1
MSFCGYRPSGSVSPPWPRGRFLTHKLPWCLSLLPPVTRNLPINVSYSQLGEQSARNGTLLPTLSSGIPVAMHLVPSLLLVLVFHIVYDWKWHPCFPPVTIGGYPFLGALIPSPPCGWRRAPWPDTCC